MPWTTDENGDKKYVASIFSKDELPTWNEMYNDWYKQRIFSFKNDSKSELDPYWKIPRNLYLLAAACNQLNKHVLEDGVDLKELESILDMEVYGIKFTLHEFGRPIYFDAEEPPIYTFPNPNGLIDPFITNQHERIKVIDMDNVYLMIHVNGGTIADKKSAYRAKRGRYALGLYSKEFIPVLEYFMKPYKEYFENGVGWKDPDGNLIDIEKVPFDRNKDAAL